MDFSSLLSSQGAIQTLLPAAFGGITNYLVSDAKNKSVSQGANNYQNAINYLIGQQGLPSNGFFASAGPNGASTGTGYDAAIRQIAAAQLGQQLDAARLNLARGNMTDADARASVYAQQVAQNNALNTGAMNSAAKAAARLPGYTSNMKSVYDAGKLDALKSNRLAYANAMNVIADNDANYMNNPAMADALRQQLNYNNNNRAYNTLIAELMGKTPVSGTSNKNAVLQGVVSGLGQGLSKFFTNKVME